MITKDLATRALSKLTTPTAYEYFFENLKSAEWIKPLQQAKPDIFKKPIKAVRTDQGWSFPWWPESRYLARVADQSPNEVVQIVLGLEATDNTRVHDDFAEAALKIPLKDARKLVPKLLEWLDSEFLMFLPEKAAALAAKFSEAKDCDVALKIIDKVLDLKVVPFTGDPNTPFNKDKVVTRYFDYHFQEILKEFVPVIVAGCGVPAIKVLENKLLFALKTEGDLADLDTDHSFIWRPAIEDHHQNYGEHIKDHLLAAVRDSYESYIRTNPQNGINVIKELLKSQHSILIRMGIHLLRLEELKDSDLGVAILHDPKFYDLIPTWFEFSHLLSERYPNLSKANQDVILEIIKNLEQRANGDAQKVKYLRADRHRSYSMISSHLTGDAVQLFNELKKEFGESEHPDFHSYTSATWVGPTSPIDLPDLEKMSPDDLLQYLLTWVPTKEWASPSREGLGRSLESIIKNNPQPILSLGTKLKGLHPTYLRSVVQALRETDKPFDWNSAIDICSWISTQADKPVKNVSDDEDPGFRWAKAAVARLLTRGFEGNSIPWDLRDKSWKVLEPITMDSDPDAEHEAKYLKGRTDYYQYSINTTRGEALHAVVSYGLWVKRQAKIDDKDSVFKVAPEVPKVLDAHLDLKIDPQVGMRAVYGRWLPWLFLMDKDWTKDRLSLILPKDPALSNYRESAWNTYVVFCGVYANVFSLIADEYLFELNNITRVIATAELSSHDPLMRIGEHLMVMYWQGHLGDPDQSVHLKKFFEVSPEKVRENAINFIGRALQKNKGADEVPPEVVARLIALWNWRKSQPLASVRTELSEFGWWAISHQFDPDWVLPELDAVLKMTEWIKPDSLIFDNLQKYVDTHSKQLLAVTRSFVEGPVKKGKVWLMKERFMKFLEALKQKVEPNDRKEFVDLIDALAASGYLEFRPLAKF